MEGCPSGSGLPFSLLVVAHVEFGHAKHRQRMGLKGSGVMICFVIVAVPVCFSGFLPAAR